MTNWLVITVVIVGVYINQKEALMLITWGLALGFVLVMQTIIFVMWVISNNKDYGYKRVYWFVDTVGVVNDLSAKSGYWVMSLAVLIVSWILPATDSADMDSPDRKYYYWYKANGDYGEAWGGPISVLFYIFFAAINTVVQLEFYPCLINWRKEVEIMKDDYDIREQLRAETEAARQRKTSEVITFGDGGEDKNQCEEEGLSAELCE